MKAVKFITILMLAISLNVSLVNCVGKSAYEVLGAFICILASKIVTEKIRNYPAR